MTAPKTFPKKERGPVSEQHLYILTLMYAYLTKHVNVKDIAATLVSKFVISIDEKNKAANAAESDRVKGMEVMIDILRESGSSALPKFIDCLNETGYKTAANMLIEKLESTTNGGSDKPQNKSGSKQSTKPKKSVFSVLKSGAMKIFNELNNKPDKPDQKEDKIPSTVDSTNKPDKPDQKEDKLPSTVDVKTTNGKLTVKHKFKMTWKLWMK